MFLYVSLLVTGRVVLNEIASFLCVLDHVLFEMPQLLVSGGSVKIKATPTIKRRRTHQARGCRR